MGISSRARLPAPMGFRMTSAKPAAFLVLLPAVQCSIAQAKTPLQFLREASSASFRPGHTLPPLTRWGWSMEYDVRVELCERWGYALEFGDDASAENVKQLEDPKSEASR